MINVLSKTVESTKVQLSEAEKAVTFSKNAEVKALKDLTVKKSALESAEKSGENAKKAVTSAEDKLAVATKKLQEANAKAAESKFAFSSSFVQQSCASHVYPTHT